MPRARHRDLFGKRVLGYVNWHRGRKLVHRREMLDVLTQDIVGREPDHIAVTGELVNLGLPEEFVFAAEWLRHLGPPERVTAIPGNHDAYVRLHPERGTGHWRPTCSRTELERRSSARRPTGFPFVRRFGDVALVALSSAVPTMPFIAAGRLGSAQRFFSRPRPGRARACRGCFAWYSSTTRHFPAKLAGGAACATRASLTAACSRSKGAELVLHGHNHEQTLFELATVTGPAIVVGVPSASEAVSGRISAARYNEYRIGEGE